MAPVANAVVDKGSGSQVSKLSKKIVKFSSSGRKITVPKKILPTSSDEMPPRKPKQSVADMQKELNELRSLAKQKEYASKLQANDSILRSEIKIKNKVPNKISITASDALITKNNPSSSSPPTQKKSSSTSKQDSTQHAKKTDDSNGKMSTNSAFNKSRITESEVSTIISTLLGPGNKSSSKNESKNIVVTQIDNEIVQHVTSPVNVTSPEADENNTLPR